MTTRGIIYIALGSKAELAAKASIESLRIHWRGEIDIISDVDIAIAGTRTRHVNIPASYSVPDNVRASRYCKVRLDLLTRWEQTLYIDADTLVRGPIDAGFAILADGYDLALTHSGNQGEDALWHVDTDEAWYTQCQLFHTPLQLQAGMMFFSRTPEVENLFFEWRKQWEIWHGQDQAALLRALYAAPVKTWIFGRPWNGGALIEHRFGRARA